MTNKKKMAIASLVLSILTLIPLVISPSDLEACIMVIMVDIVLALGAIVLGYLGKSDSKMGIAGIVIGVISAGLLGLALIGFQMFKTVENCVENKNGIATCEYLEQQVDIPVEYLRDDQFKK